MQKICPNCHQTVSATSYYCLNCGVALNENPIIVSPQQNISIAGRDVTSRQLKQIGTSIAVSALAILAEVSLIYVQRRLAQLRDPATSITSSKKRWWRKNRGEVATTEIREEQGEVVTVVRERVVEIRRWGRPMQRVIERMVWRREPTR